MSTGDPAYLSAAKQVEIVEALPETLHRKASEKMLSEVALAIAALRCDNVVAMPAFTAIDTMEYADFANAILDDLEVLKTVVNAILTKMQASGLMDPVLPQ